MTDIANWLRERRTQYGISQRQLCAKLGINVMTYSRYERGISRPSADVLEQVENFYERRASRAGAFIEKLTPKQRKALFTILDLVDGGGVASNIGRACATRRAASQGRAA